MEQQKQFLNKLKLNLLQQQADDLVQYFWVGVLFFIALIEGQNILTGWESPEDTNTRSTGKDNLKGAQLKEDYINGRIWCARFSLLIAY